MGWKRLCQTVLLCLVSTAAGAQVFTSVVVFGDSLSDTGNFAHVTNADYGIVYPGPDFNYATGRFTDDTGTTPAAHTYSGVWVEQLAAHVSAHPAVTDSLDGGTNYAYGDATTADGYSTITVSSGVSITIANMGQQVANYLATKPTPGGAILYVVFGGSNDLFADSSQSAVAAAAQREANLVQLLLNAGATNFLVPNLPPLGNTPEYAGTANAATLNTAASQFSSALASDLQTVVSAARAQGISVTIYEPDLYSAFKTLEANPANYGFANGAASAQGLDSTVNPDTYLFWDDIHPTTGGHLVIAATAETLLPGTVLASTTALTATSSTNSSTLTFTAVVSGSGETKPTGGVTIFSGTPTNATAIASATLDATGTGTATFSGTAPSTVFAVYMGDLTYQKSASSPQSPQTAAATSTSLSASSSSITVGEAVMLTATVTSSAGIPTGTVTFYDGGTALGSGTLNGSGKATFTTSTLASGSHSITARYPATGAYEASTSSVVTIVVSQSGGGLTFTPSSLSFAATAVGTTTAAQVITIKNTSESAVSFTASTTITGSGASSFIKSASTCANPLAAGASCTNSIEFDPTVSGSLSAVVTYTDTAAGSPQTVGLSGTGASAGTGLTITPSSLTFASTTVGTSAATQVITLKNNTSASVSFTAATTITGTGASSFAKTASTCGTLAAGASCTNTITFTPASAGTLTATVSYHDSASSTPQTVALSGTGASASAGLTITPSSLTFASTTVGTSAATQMITLKNNTSASVTFTAGTTITGTGASSFAKTASTCGTLAAGASCTNTITFTPASAGTLTATVTYHDSASSTPQTVALSGTGASASAGLTITPTSLTFPSTIVGTSAATQVITLKNNTSAAVSFTASTTITGTGASSFAKTASTCGTLAAGASCTNTITFTPASAGALTATVTYHDSASSTPQTVALSGTGAAAGLTFSPTSLSFASTAVGTTTAAQMVTIKNVSASPVSFTATTTITGSGASSFIKSASTCTNPLPAGASCTNSIEFDPKAAGALAAVITYTDTATGSPQTVPLSGTGH